MTRPAYAYYYETTARPRIVRALRRLCDEYGWDMVLGVFSNDMPEHREERERQEQEERETKQRERQARKRRKASAEVVSLDAWRRESGA